MVDVDALPDAELVRMVTSIRKKMVRVWMNMQRTSLFDRYWEKLYEMRRSGFRGRVAMVNREDVLTDGWIQSLFGIFGRNNTVIELVSIL